MVNYTHYVSCRNRRISFGFNPSFHFETTIKSLKIMRFCIYVKGQIESKDLCASIASSYQQ